MSIRWRTYQYVQNSFYEHQSHCAVVRAFAKKMMLLPYASCSIMFLLLSNHQKRRAGWMTSELKVQLLFLEVLLNHWFHHWESLRDWVMLSSSTLQGEALGLSNQFLETRTFVDWSIPYINLFLGHPRCASPPCGCWWKLGKLSRKHAIQPV